MKKREQNYKLEWYDNDILKIGEFESKTYIPRSISHKETEINFYGRGRGDLMIIKQLIKAFQKYIREYRDPKIGQIVLSYGGSKQALDAEEGDINLYWWWSFGKFDDTPDKWIDYYMENVKTKPDVILCPSHKTFCYAMRKGYRAVYLPLGVGEDFKPLGLERKGLGYAGTKGHKRDTQRERIIGDFMGRDDFEFVTDIKDPKELNEWYNSKLITFGMTKQGQSDWGIVNNRVFEALASGTPFVMHSHPWVEDVLGFEFPYQSKSKLKTKEIVGYIENDKESVLEQFAEYSNKVIDKHSYINRLEKLFNYLKYDWQTGII